jgi:aryl-alcohol dehydrogenase-like predicted oxidoreductase
MARRDEIVIATKVYSAMSDAPNMSGLSRKHIVQGCEASLKRLRLEAIDLYQLHRFDPKTPIEETLAALDDLVHAGKVRYIGASSGPAWRMMEALGVSRLNRWTRFATMQNHYNLLYREEEREMIPLCLQEGVGLVPWSPLARGVLTRPRPASGSVRTNDTARSASDDYSPRLYDDSGDWNVVDAVDRLARDRGVTMAEVALAGLLGRPGVAAPIIGATKLEHLEAAGRALTLHLTPEETARLESPYRPHGVKGHSS